jgi:hypothetical protein
MPSSLRRSARTPPAASTSQSRKLLVPQSIATYAAWPISVRPILLPASGRLHRISSRSAKACRSAAPSMYSRPRHCATAFPHTQLARPPSGISVKNGGKGSKTAARRFDCFTRPWCNGAGIPQCFALHALRTHPAKSAAGLCYPSSQLHMIGRRTARLTPAAPPSATHPRRSRGPPVGGSGANPRDWRRAAWGRARADASSRAAPRPAGPRAHGSPR